MESELERRPLGRGACDTPSREFTVLNAVLMGRDRGPDILDVALADAVGLHKLFARIGAIDLEAQVRARIFFSQAHVVEHCAEIVHLGVVFETAALAGERAPE